MVGTASVVRRYLLLEAPGPWGIEVLRDARLAADFKAELRRLSRRTGVRVLLIRRYRQRPTQPARQFFLASVGPAGSWLVGGIRDDLRSVLDLDLMGPPERMSGTHPRTDPVFGVCTHGRHDPCCAERGRPLARAVTAAFPDETWECSHLGGDRFAGNMLCLPGGVCYGRVAPEDGAAVAATHAAGRIDPVHLRGRAGYGFAVQAAEWHLRNRLGLLGLSDVTFVAERSRNGTTVVVFDTAGHGRWSATITVSRAHPHPLTCNAVSPFAAPRFELSKIEEVPA
jgi:hypothetical protein